MSLTFHPEGTPVSAGATVMLQCGSSSTPYFVASNIFTQTTPGNTRITATSNSEPQARSTFVVSPSSASSDGAIRYGQHITLASHPLLHIIDPASGTVGLQQLLSSQRASNITGSAIRGRQEVVGTTRRSADNEWIVTPASGDMLLAEGNPVFAGDHITLVHAMSGVPVSLWLRIPQSVRTASANLSHALHLSLLLLQLAASTSETYPTDFGVELDVHCALHRPTGHSAMKASGDMPMRASMPANVFSFVVGSSPAASSSAGLKHLSPRALVDRARAMIAGAAGIHGLRSLSLAFASLDAKGSGQIPVEGAKYALYDHGVAISDAEFALLFSAFTASAFVAAADVMAALRGTLSAERQETIRTAYEHLCKVFGSTVSVDALRSKYDAKFDPRVQAKRLTAAEAAAEFSRQWFHVRGNTAVSLAAFMEYYADVAPCVADDFEFETLVANMWHISGRGSWRGALSKRVSITFHAGSSTEVVVPNGELIADDDFPAMIEALRKLGFGGVARYTVVGLVDPAE